MPAILSPSAKQQFFTDGSTVAAGYRLHTYLANSANVPAETYRDRAGTVPNTNPIILDARGEATIYLQPGVVYDYVLKTDQGATVWTQEDVTADSGDANAVTFLQAGTDAVSRSSQDKSRERLTPYDFGAVGDGVTDDRIALLKADAAAFDQGKAVWFPYGTFLVSAALTGLRASWVGENGHQIKASGTLVLNGPSMLEWAAGSDGVEIRGINVDFNNRTCTVGSEAVIGVAASANFVVEDCTVENMIGCGIAANGAQNFSISRNTIKRAAYANTYNQAILVSSASRQSKNGVIDGNVCENSAINVSVANCSISDNDIYGWGFGGGITTEQDTANSFNYTIENNRIRESQGIDTNLTRPMGVENWGANSVIRGNIIWDCSGSGIDNGGQNTRVTDNICFNNGRTLATSGIVSRYGNATYNASGSSVHGNKCFDTQGSPTQTKSYSEQSSSLTGISVRNNQFNSAAGVTPETIISSGCDYIGPSLEDGVAWNPASLASGSSTSTTLTVAGAKIGDYVTTSFTDVLQGCSLTGYVSADNTVTVVLSNLTGVAQDLGAGTVRARVSKPRGYSTF